MKVAASVVRIEYCILAKAVGTLGLANICFLFLKVLDLLVVLQSEHEGAMVFCTWLWRFPVPFTTLCC
jgi:hypothetical protein